MRDRFIDYAGNVWTWRRGAWRKRSKALAPIKERAKKHRKGKKLDG